MSKHEQTVLRALRDGWYIEEIEELTGKDSFSIFRLARRHGLNARHAPTRPDFMRARAIAHSVESVGDIQTSIKYRICLSTVWAHVKRYREMEHLKYAKNAKIP